MIAALIMAQAISQSAILPIQFLRMCATQPAAHCELERPLTREDIAWLNFAINQGLPPAGEDARLDRWTIFPDGPASCADYAVSKRAALIALGFPPSALTLVIGTAERGGVDRPHIVLEASLNGETLILDNLELKNLYGPHTRPRPWQEIARESHSGLPWIQALP